MTGGSDILSSRSFLFFPWPRYGLIAIQTYSTFGTSALPAIPHSTPSPTFNKPSTAATPPAETEGRILITAEPGRMIENLTLRDVYLKYPMIEDPVPNVERAKSGQFSPMNPEAKIAGAALVAENVRNLVVDNFNVDWPETENTPEAWRHPKRIANGTHDAFYPQYDPARQTEFSAVWGRNLQGGYLHTPLAMPSNPEKPRFDIMNSTIVIK